MNFNQRCIVSHIFVIHMIHLVYCASLPEEGKNRWSGANRRAKFWCKKYKQCLNFGVNDANKPVCGWDEELTFLAVFENECVLYHANCNNAGRFFIVKMDVCDTKKKYDEDHPDEKFEWYSVLPSSTTMSKPRLYYSPQTLEGKKRFHTVPIMKLV